jgi:hypothetical protein
MQQHNNISQKKRKKEVAISHPYFSLIQLKCSCDGIKGGLINFDEPCAARRAHVSGKFWNFRIPGNMRTNTLRWGWTPLFHFDQEGARPHFFTLNVLGEIVMRIRY